MSSSTGSSVRLTPVLLLLGVLLLGGVAFFYRGTLDPVRERLVTVRSGGGSLGGRDRVIVRGDEVSYGDHVQVLNRPLVTSMTDSSVVLAFEPGSRWQYRGLYTGARWPQLVVRKGEGRVRVQGRAVRLVFPSESLHVEAGSVRWKLKGSDLEFRTSSTISGYVLEDGAAVSLTQGASRAEVYASPGFAPEPPDLPRAYSGPPAQSSSLISGERLSRRIKWTARRTGQYPGTLRDVFGHWVRDRWGNVYYYDPGPEGFTLISGGPDERVFTNDDRRWTE